MITLRTVKDLLASGGDEAPAIAAHGAPPLACAGFRSLIDDTIATLNRLGVGRNDRVAIVLPNGPEMATAFVAIASASTSAPLNPSYRTDEFEFYMDDLKAKALVVEAGSASPAIEAATRLGIAILTLTPSGAAGGFTLSGGPLGASARPGAAEPEDIAALCIPRVAADPRNLLPFGEFWIRFEGRFGAIFSRRKNGRT
jgi:hypothetical protein